MTDLVFTDTLVGTVVEVITLIAALGIVLMPSSIYAALCLGITLISIAFIYLLLDADFLAAAQILIYVGAINVLIVFAIMLVNQGGSGEKGGEGRGGFATLRPAPPSPSTSPTGASTPLGQKPWRHKSLAVIVTSLLSIPLALASNQSQWTLKGIQLTKDWAPLHPTSLIGAHLFQDFLLPFEVLSFLLLVALIGAIQMARISPGEANEE
uniref:NAD(P)H-quinone oxidoreductase subunit 6, chloroplastic n=1 Tax=Entransia fimbriata TaxID=130991 RepID=A0A191T4N8_9VIRI|nr:subunit 6 of NADH-plastoquinone oxidoreductase [Entransia fimbriata]YP_009256726.1 subunit 6 of NADH-plastoquinone oxidoreductase [Entransia fimbriata]ANI25363.1 subunit 6 of NADH-plastoquinone oxidoreductase [Entransia fimbriata]ANI25430.1 subunit 6 of NADH-plastoquinone oxidoreductase [Entransia fimbriata]WKT05759.1 subunit 6 of NADH-plastoquinone oxidoreductase [Entransia fimbriata]WKT05760.1 subunit 6 of NADH-plastoquinone oxidoreductase [Entransia fimbriata]WKT05878.1 subunit 6 of NAD